MHPEVLSRHQFGDMVALYRTQDGQMDLVIHPLGLEPAGHRRDPAAESVEGLVQLHVVGDRLSGNYLGGRSMRRGGTKLQLTGQALDGDRVPHPVRERLDVNGIGLDVLQNRGEHQQQHEDAPVRGLGRRQDDGNLRQGAAPQPVGLAHGRQPVAEMAEPSGQFTTVAGDQAMQFGTVAGQ